MKLINNRYRVKSSLKDHIIVEDVFHNDKLKYIQTYHMNKDSNLIDYFVDDFLQLSSIKHKNLVELNSFDIINNINLKEVDIGTYYTTTVDLDYVESVSILEADIDFSLNDILNIFLDLSSLVSFLHFRGIVYKVLNPENIFIRNDKSIKVMDLAMARCKIINSNYNQHMEKFIAPEILIKQTSIDKMADYYSLGRLLEYLLYEKCNFSNLKMKSFEEDYLKDIITKMTVIDPMSRNINLREYIDKIINIFNLDYTYDLINERNNILSNTKLVGRNQEIDLLMDIDKSIKNGTNSFKGILIKGQIGVGKSRLTKEISYRLKIRGRNVYNMEIDGINEIDNFNNLNIIRLLKLLIKDAPIELTIKYEVDFQEILSSLNHKGLINNSIDLNSKNRKYRLFNKMSNFIYELSKEKPMYLIIDELEKSEEVFLDFLDYLFGNPNIRNVFLVMNVDEVSLYSNSAIKERVYNWMDSNTIRSLNLDYLEEEYAGEVIKSILGISYIPKKFTTLLYKKTQGNVFYLDYIIKNLYDRGELFLHENGYWELKTKDYTNIKLPTNIIDVMKGQLSKISGDYLNVFKAMSIFESSLYKETISRMLDINIIEIDKILSKLIEERFIIEKHTDLGSKYKIYNVGLKTLVYSDLNQEEKLHLHKKASETILSLYSESLSLVMNELIYHLIRSNNSKLAIELIMNEISITDNKYSANSTNLLEQAYTILENNNTEDELKILDMLTEIYTTIGEVDKSKYYFNKLIASSKKQNNKFFLIKSKYYETDFLIKQNKLEMAGISFHQLETLSREYNKPEGIINTLIMRSKMELSQDITENIESYLMEAIYISENNKIDKYLGTIYNILGYLNYIKGNPKLAILNYEKSINLFYKSGNEVESIKPLNNMANIYSGIYDNKTKALEYYENGLKIAHKFNLIHSKTIFHNNIGETYLEIFQIDKALEYFEESKRVATNTKDFRISFLSNVNLGLIYITKAKYKRAHTIYSHLKKEFENRPIFDLEIRTQYYNFLGEFYSTFGKWEEALEYTELAIQLSKDFNIKNFLKAESRKIYIKFKSNKEFDKGQIVNLINQYKEANIESDKLEAMIFFGFISHLAGDILFSKQLIEEYDISKGNNKFEILEDISKLIRFINSPQEGEIYKMQAYIKNSNYKLYNLDIFSNMILGKIFFERKCYYESINYLLESLNLLFKYSEEIDDTEFKKTYIKTKSGDYIKELISKAISIEFNKQVKYDAYSDNELMDYRDYFNIKEILKVLTKEELNSIINKDNDNIPNSTEELLSVLVDDNIKNLDTILKYLVKETLAKSGCIISVKDKEYTKLACVNSPENWSQNISLLEQVNRNKTAIIINKNDRNYEKDKYKDFLTDNLVGIICIPNYSNKIKLEGINDRRKDFYYSENSKEFYIYLETISYFNRFDTKSLNLINNLIYLIDINIENYMLRHIANTDKLTGTLTKKHFEEKLSGVIRTFEEEKKEFSLLMIDIDDFKEVNDNLGHIKGDEVLKGVGGIILSSVRDTDLVGRYGGEEFIVALLNTTGDQGLKIAEKIRYNIEEFRLPGSNRKTTISIGLANYPTHSLFEKDLIDKADQALYYAKKRPEKNNSVIWNQNMKKYGQRADKLAGIYTGYTNTDYRNALTLVNIIDLIQAKKQIKDKTYIFLGWLIDILEAEDASLLYLDEAGNIKDSLSRSRRNLNWTQYKNFNSKLVRETFLEREGMFLIDWDYALELQTQKNIPNWQSIMIVPLIYKDIFKGIIYVSVPLEEMEFNFNNYNFVKLLCNVFVVTI